MRFSRPANDIYFIEHKCQVHCMFNLCLFCVFIKKYENSVERCVILHVVSCHLQLLLVFIKKESTELLTDSFHNDGRQVQ